MEAFVTERSGETTAQASVERKRQEEGDAQPHQEEGDDSPEDMDALMEAVAKAISQTEREAVATHVGDAREWREMRETEATLTT